MCFWKGTQNDGNLAQMLKELINVASNSKAGFVSVLLYFKHMNWTLNISTPGALR